MAKFMGDGPTLSTTDEQFRAWTKHMFDTLIATGGGLLTQTADTGQINFTTVLRPTAGSTYYYFILKFDDGLGPAIYLKFKVGAHATVTNPAAQLEVGTGTDGVGGLINGNAITTATGSVVPSVSPAPTRVCVLPGYVGAVFGREHAAEGSCLLQFALSRHQDDQGVFLATGFSLFGSFTSANAGTFVNNLSINFPPSYRFVTEPASVVNPYSRTSWKYQAKVQPMPVFYEADRLRVSGTLCYAPLVDVALDSEITTALVGATPRTYLSAGLTSNGGTPIRTLMLWE